MRIGVVGIATFAIIFSLIIINSSPKLDEKIVDQIFENIDQNFSTTSFSEDQNLDKFVIYTVRGVANEFHGLYYLASWMNPYLPEWLSQNSGLLAVVAILVICSPIIAVLFKYLFLVFFAVVIFLHDKIKKRREIKNEKHVGQPD